MSSQPVYRLRIWHLAGMAMTWLALGLQFYLLIVNRTGSATEAIWMYFGYFTILTNLIVALYFTNRYFRPDKNDYRSPGVTTAVTSYILLVGLSYQVLLRHIWSPQGLAMIADELLHTIIPAFVFCYWLFTTPKRELSSNMISRWVVYPLLYFVYALVRGLATGFYPYYFIDVKALGWQPVLINSAQIALFYLILANLLIYLPKLFRRGRPTVV